MKNTSSELEQSLSLKSVLISRVGIDDNRTFKAINCGKSQGPQQVLHAQILIQTLPITCKVSSSETSNNFTVHSVWIDTI